MSARTSHGFTLLEILVSLAIMSIVLTFAFRAYKGISDAHERLTAGIDRGRAAGVLLDRLERELVGTVMIEREDGADPLLHPYLFVTGDGTLNQEGSDSLRFVTQTPTRMPGLPRRTSLVMVTYGVEALEPDVLSLVRREEPLPDQMEKDILLDEGLVVADELAGFKLRFQGMGGPWTESWDSTGVSNLDQIPDSVEVSVKMWDRDGDGQLVEGRELVRQVRLPVRPFRLAPDDPNALGGACETGTSVQQCIDAFQIELDVFGDALLVDEVNTLASEIQDPCWNTETPSEKRILLQTILEENLREPDFGKWCP